MKKVRRIVAIVVHVGLSITAALMAWTGALGLEIKNWWWVVAAIVMRNIAINVAHKIQGNAKAEGALAMLKDTHDTLDAQKAVIESSTNLIELQAKEIELLNKEITQ